MGVLTVLADLRACFLQNTYCLRNIILGFLVLYCCMFPNSTSKTVSPIENWQPWYLWWHDRHHILWARNGESPFANISNFSATHILILIWYILSRFVSSPQRCRLLMCNNNRIIIMMIIFLNPLTSLGTEQWLCNILLQFTEIIV